MNKRLPVLIFVCVFSKNLVCTELPGITLGPNRMRMFEWVMENGGWGYKVLSKQVSAVTLSLSRGLEPAGSDHHDEFR